MSQRSVWREGFDLRYTAIIVALSIVACRPGAILDVAPPLGVISSGDVTSADAANNVYNGAKGNLLFALMGNNEVFHWSEQLSDEFTFTRVNSQGRRAGPDARRTAAFGGYPAGGYPEFGNTGLILLLSARSDMLIAETQLARYAVASTPSKVAEAFALVGYAELALAESYCAGVPLSRALPQGGSEYGMPLTTDSLLSVAEAHFDSALAHAGSDSATLYMAQIGLGRARLGRGKFADAAAAVINVPTSFVYNVNSEPSTALGAPFQINMYAAQLPANSPGGAAMNVADNEGGNGLNYRSARDPRLAFDSTVTHTFDGGTFYYPIKFGNPASDIPLATGVEARLIEAEDALHNGQIAAWKASLDGLRANAAMTYLHLGNAMPGLTDDSTTAADATLQVNVMFRERAFWLFGTGSRLGDMRRMIRQYGRNAETVFPTGAYPYASNTHLPAPLPTYGTDVSLTLPTPASGYTTGNPNYRGCLTSPATP